MAGLQVGVLRQIGKYPLVRWQLVPAELGSPQALLCKELVVWVLVLWVLVLVLVLVQWWVMVQGVVPQVLRACLAGVVLFVVLQPACASV